MAPTFQTLVSRFRRTTLANGEQPVFKTAPEGKLFTKTDPLIDGEECLHDCEDCTVELPASFKIDEEDKLYGHVKGWSTHLIVATGKTDWVRDVADEKGSVMEAVGKGTVQPENGKLMLSASNMPLPSNSANTGKPDDPTTVLLLPAFTFIDNVTPSSVPDLIKTYVNNAPTNTTPLFSPPQPSSSSSPPQQQPSTNGTKPSQVTTPTSNGIPATPSPPPLTPRNCPHNYLILLCSQRTRDARCGQSAPLLKKEFERQLRPLGLYRDPTDTRPGGVGIYFISHVGGHKYSANCFVYRRSGTPGTGVPEDAIAAGAPSEVINPESAEDDGSEKGDVRKANGSAAANGVHENGDGAANGVTNGTSPVAAAAASPFGDLGAGAAQCIWLARVRPEDCENIVRYTVLQGKVVKPERQLRGGFDRCKGLVSW